LAHRNAIPHRVRGKLDDPPLNDADTMRLDAERVMNPQRPGVAFHECMLFIAAIDRKSTLGGSSRSSGC
jgi:hypothetical protein